MAWLVLAAAGAFAAEQADNIASGKKYTLFPAPSYTHCTDPGDAVQLTDGKTTEDYFWTQPGTVGWQSVEYAMVTIDLERVESIAGLSFRTAAGVAGVQWPGAIHVLTSDDGHAYRDAGDLVAMDLKAHGPWPKGYAIRRLFTGDLRTRGRFVRLLILPAADSPFTFVDEIEVLRGAPELLHGEPAGEPVGSVEELRTRWRIQTAVQRRFEADIAAVASAVDRDAPKDDAARKRLRDRLTQAAEALRASTVPLDGTFQAVLPYNDAHARLFQVQAELWKPCGPLSACIPPTWDPLDSCVPLPTSLTRIEVHTMRGEYRAAALNLTNTTDRPIEARLHLDGLPGSPAPGYVTLHEVAWTDTPQGRPVAAALPEARQGEGARDWRVRVFPGLVRQVWMTFHATDVAPGDYAGAVVVESEAAETMRIPLRLRVYALDFPQQTTLMVGGWGYTNGRGSYGITPENRAAFVRHLKDHFVNAPWANSGVMPPGEFADDGSVRLDTQELDAWLAEWPGCKRYHVFLAAGEEFHGAKAGTPEFNRRVATWISAWVRHLGAKGIAAERLALLVVDEPRDGIDVTALVAWAKAIRAAEPKVLVWEDPIYPDPGKSPAEVYEVSHVLCPNRPMWLAQGKTFADFFLAQQRQGRELQFYSCSGPAMLLDPYSYYRLQAWHAWQVHATGSFFWAFGDNSGASSWNPYLAQAGPFTPLFLDAKTVIAGKQMEAIRESIEDFEYLVMLRKAVDRAKAAGRSDAALTQAESLLRAAPDDVLAAQGAEQILWHAPKDRTLADQARVRILDALSALR